MKVLVIRFSSIGDIVLTTPVVRVLHQQLNAEVHYLTKPAHADLLRGNTGIAKVHKLSSSLWETAKDLRHEQYDVVIDLHNNLRSFLLKRMLRVKSYSFYKANYEKWRMVQFKQNHLPGEHIVQRYLNAVLPLGAQDDNGGLDYYALDKLPLQLPEKFVCWAIGGQHLTKILPSKKIMEAISLMPNIPVVLIGGTEDEARGNAVASAFPKQVINLCSQLSVAQSAAVVERACVVVSNDTGMMHIAAALKKKVVSIWGNTIPAFGMTPYKTDYELMEVKKLDCRPCSKLGHDECPQQHFDCMMKQDTSAIASAIQRYYKEATTST